MTGFESKRQMAQDKLTDEADTLTIAYQSGFADGKKAAQRKPLTATVILNLMPGSIPSEYDGALMEFARDVEQAHNIKEQP
jgi:hypothetical protein